MFKFLTYILDLFTHCTGCLSARHHLGGCVVEDFIGVQAFNCPSLHGDCLFVEPKRIGLTIDFGAGDVEFFYIRGIIKGQAGLRVPGVYIYYQPLFGNYVRRNGSFFYSDNWLASAKSVATDKTLMVPVELVLDPRVAQPDCVESLTGWGLKPVRERFDSQYYFPAVAWEG